MKYSPHDYQKYSADYIEAHPVAAIFLDCGLGKTLITLTAVAGLLFDSFEVSRVLVIAPLRVARDTWPSEIAKWDHLSHLTYAVAVGSPAERKAAVEAHADITIINRENVEWLAENMPFDFDMVVVDELSSFKNHKAKRFRALMSKRPLVKRIVGLTGTPSSNGLMDLWAEFKLLDMGQRLGRFISQYRDIYFSPSGGNGYVTYSWRPLPGAEDAIYKAISDITISMKASDHLKMPELVMSEYPVTLSHDEKAAYSKFKHDLVLSLPDGDVTAASAAVLSGKLCQMANGAVYDDDQAMLSIHDRKLEALEDIIESMNGRPLLIAYWYRHDFERIKQRFKVREIKSSADIADWNAGRIPVACVHPASAGHGLNLQSGGSTLVWFGLPWSLELYQQTNARLWRQGQKNTVVIQHIIAKGTIDEQVATALKNKNTTQTALIEAVKACL